MFRKLKKWFANRAFRKEPDYNDLKKAWRELTKTRENVLLEKRLADSYCQDPLKRAYYAWLLNTIDGQRFAAELLLFELEQNFLVGLNDERISIMESEIAHFRMRQYRIIHEPAVLYDESRRQPR